MIQLHHNNTFFVLHKMINRQLKNMMTGLFHHWYCGILAAVITIPVVLMCHGYHTRRITIEFSAFLQ